MICRPTPGLLTTLMGAGLFFCSEPAQAEPITGVASWYSVEACRVNPDPHCPTASGRSLYDLEQEAVLFLATWDYPLGTTVRVTHGTKSLNAIVLDRGPARRLVRDGRRWDLSRALFAALAPLEEGVIPVTVSRIDE